MNKFTLYTTGYSGDKTNKKPGKAEAFDAMVARHNLLVVDIRMTPWSQADCWRKPTLTGRLGDAKLSASGRYLHIPELGNRNYKSGGAVSIVNLAYGVKRVLQAVETTRKAPLLLCGCEYHDCCHREEVGQAFKGKAAAWFELKNWMPLVITADAPNGIGVIDLSWMWQRVV